MYADVWHFENNTCEYCQFNTVSAKFGIVKICDSLKITIPYTKLSRNYLIRLWVKLFLTNTLNKFNFKNKPSQRHFFMISENMMQQKKSKSSENIPPQIYLIINLPSRVYHKLKSKYVFIKKT